MTQPATAQRTGRFATFTRRQWIGAGVLGVLGIIAIAAVLVFGARALLATAPLRDFVATYPGGYALPVGAPVGIPGWLAWQHFFNVFLIALVVQSGLRLRREQRPDLFWTSRRTGGKISFALWFHQGIDALWLVNGIAYIVLLFATGQWMRVVPTSIDVLPNALSAALQYASLDWPTSHGWAHYNALQQLSYFATIFLAAPLAAASGYRLSSLWPRKNRKLRKLVPVEWARKVHFPTMLYFMVFIAVHVALVLATGALRNLNTIYAAQGSLDPDAFADNWTGFWLFVVSLAVIAGACVAARPRILTPIARVFGTVEGR